LPEGRDQARKVLKMDASKRSQITRTRIHGFAAKRIVLFDTLLAGMNEDEVLAVLATRWSLKRHHLIKSLCFTEAYRLALCFFV
jgi:STE24 endopeptidase